MHLSHSIRLVTGKIPRNNSSLRKDKVNIVSSLFCTFLYIFAMTVYYTM